MKLPPYTAETPPPRESGLARATAIGALTRTGDIEVWRGVSQIGGTIQKSAGLGYRAWQERHDIDTGIQHAKSTSALNMAYTDILGELDNMPVETDRIRQTTRVEKLKELEDLYNQTLTGLDNPDAANMLKKSWELLKPQYDTGIYRTLTGNLDKQQKYDKMTEWQALLSNAALDNIETVKEGVRQDVEKHIPLFGAAWAKTFIGNLDKITTAVREDYYNDLIYNGVSDLAVLTLQVQQDDSVDKKQLLKNIDEERKRREGIAEEEIEEQQAETNKQLSDLMANNQLTINAIKEQRAILDDTDYKNWLKIALNPPDKKGSPVKSAELYGDALDIWRGAIKKPEFDKRLLASLARSDGINEDEYKSLMQTAEQTLKTSQAEALSRADTEAGRLIVDVRDDQSVQAIIARMGSDESKRFIEKRQLQFWFLSQYNKELRDWLTENPDKLGKDFYQYSEQLKHQYWNASIEEIKSRKLGTEREFGPEEFMGPTIPRPATREEWDALEKGTEYIAPDNSRRIKK